MYVSYNNLITRKEINMDLHLLAAPFREDDYEWRLQSCGKVNDKFWGLALCYVTNRAIMNRLDEVVGIENWKNDYAAAPDGGILCYLSIRINNEWVTKVDGATNTQVDPVKGGLSGAMKRAAVHWGIGRLLYNLKEGFVTICAKGTPGAHRGKTKNNEMFHWLPPKLPAWAIKQEAKQETKQEPDIDYGLTPKAPTGAIKIVDQEPKKKYKNFGFLGLMGEYKKVMSELKYYELLGKHGYEHANEIPPEKQEPALKAFAAVIAKMKGAK